MPDEKGRGRVDVEMEIRTQGGASDVWPESTGPLVHTRKTSYRFASGLEEGRGETVYNPRGPTIRTLVAELEPPTRYDNRWRGNMYGQSDFAWNGTEVSPNHIVDLDDHPYGIFCIDEVQTFQISQLIVTTDRLDAHELMVPGLSWALDRGRNLFIEGERDNETANYDDLGNAGP